MKIELDFGWDLGDTSTGGKFREKEREFEKKQREVEARKTAFIEAARKKLEDAKCVKQNRDILEAIVRKMQK